MFIIVVGIWGIGGGGGRCVSSLLLGGYCKLLDLCVSDDAK